MSKIRLSFILLLIPFCIFGQKTDVEFLLQKIKLDYPGFAEKTKGIDFDKFASKTIFNNREDTFKAMAIIVDFFKDRHLDLVKLKDTTLINKIKCTQDLKVVINYLNKKLKKYPYEGYWVNDYNNCVIAIIRKNKFKYEGYVVESRDSNILYPGSLSYEFDLTGTNVFLTKFTSDYSGTMFYIRSSFRNDSLLITGANGKWKKIKHYTNPIITSLPVFDDAAKSVLLDKDNFLVTIPICSGSNAEIIDSLLKVNYQVISRTKNLIIDIRQNMGGTVRAYLPLLPFIYTRPIKKVNIDFYCSEDAINKTQENIQAYIAKGNVDSNTLKSWYKLLQVEKDSIGKFISDKQEILKYDSVMSYPQNVGIIINYACQSAAEIMLLDCMQSDKVTLFGEHTMGAVDFLDYYALNLPSNKYQLKVATTRRIIPSGKEKLDYKGIYPNIKIPDTNNNWVDFVRHYYEEKH
ncbi:MAG: S41 family peptidase [Taibaiella sp.]|jgi:hypothetical protein